MPPQRAKANTSNIRNVGFVIYAPYAREVYLAGDFNDWDLKAIPMKRDDKGFWSAEIQLAPGTYQYNFFIDDQWIHKVPGGVEVDRVWVQDILAAELTLGAFGLHNCLITFK